LAEGRAGEERRAHGEGGDQQSFAFHVFHSSLL
jgi:hypothetical protein